jgi:hypothetical protein
LDIACRLGALSPSERSRRSEIAAKIRSNLLDIEELDRGFRLVLPNEVHLSRKALDLVLLERKCCPFLLFEFSFEPGDGLINLSVIGAQGVKEFLRENSVLGCAEL